MAVTQRRCCCSRPTYHEAVRVSKPWAGPERVIATSGHALPSCVSTLNSVSSPRSTKSAGTASSSVNASRSARRGFTATDPPVGRTRGPFLRRSSRPCRASRAAPAPAGHGGRAPSPRVDRMSHGSRQPRPSITKYCGTTLSPILRTLPKTEAGDVVLAAAVRATADLDVETGYCGRGRVGRGDDRRGASESLDCVTARRQASAGAARHVRHRVRVRETEVGGGEASIQFRKVDPAHPAEQQVLVGVTRTAPSP
jgi:hypothetical protein